MPTTFNALSGCFLRVRIPMPPPDSRPTFHPTFYVGWCWIWQDGAGRRDVDKPLQPRLNLDVLSSPWTSSRGPPLPPASTSELISAFNCASFPCERSSPVHIHSHNLRYIRSLEETMK